MDSQDHPHSGWLDLPYKGLLLAAPQGATFTSFKPGAPIT